MNTLQVEFLFKTLCVASFFLAFWFFYIGFINEIIVLQNTWEQVIVRSMLSWVGFMISLLGIVIFSFAASHPECLANLRLRRKVETDRHKDSQKPKISREKDDERLPLL